MYVIRRGPIVRLTRLISTIPPRRLFSTSSPPRPRARHPLRTSLLLTSTLSLGALTICLYTDAKTCPSPPFEVVNSSSETETSPSLLPLFRTYFVYGLISVPTLVDHAQDIFDVLLNVPLLASLVESVVRRTFFDHFVGGHKGVLLVYSVEVNESAVGTEHHDGERVNDSGQPVHKWIIDEVIKSIDVAANFEDEKGSAAGGMMGRRSCVAVKLTALLPNVQTLHNFSLHLTRTRPALNPPVPFPGTPTSSDLAVLDTSIPEESPLTVEDVRDLKDLYNDLNKICTRAKERGIRVIFDAEYSWYQPAIDAFGHALMERYNQLPAEQGWTTRWMPGSNPAQEMQVQPVVYVTYQAYLRRTTAHLSRSLTLARENGYALGVKLVRGAYHPYELAAHPSTSTSSTDTNNTYGSISISPDPYPPVHASKPDTDACYNECASVLVRAVADDLASPTSPTRPPRVGVLFGTHNWLSCELVLGELVNNGLAREDPGDAAGEGKGALVLPPDVAERITFSQLYGAFMQAHTIPNSLSFFPGI
ncbi:FAD-linked oxidoreductase [Melanogaster broomeanus]|nr:FAD-linked oxidoreductase [Melanogaster broomeanus]